MRGCRGRPAEELRADAAASRAALAAVVAAGDGIQETGDEIACVHHSATVLFNAMRGGIPDRHTRSRGRTRGFLAQRNREVAARHERALDGLPDRLTVTDLVGGRTAPATSTYAGSPASRCR